MAGAKSEMEKKEREEATVLGKAAGRAAASCSSSSGAAQGEGEDLEERSRSLCSVRWWRRMCGEETSVQDFVIAGSCP